MYSLIIAMRAVLLGRSAADAAGIIDMARRTVQTWMKRYRERSIDGLRYAPHAGRRRRRRAKLARRLHMKNMLTPKKLRGRMRNRLNVTYSAESIRRILRVLGL